MARILLIDDNVDMQKMLTVVLKKQGHEIATADRGQQGIDLAQSQTFDVVVLDVMRPDMNGYEVARHLRANPATQNLPVIILTARAQSIDQQAALDAGADAYLSKPVDIAELNTKVQELTTYGRPKPAQPPPPPPPALAPTPPAPPPTIPATPVLPQAQPQPAMYAAPAPQPVAPAPAAGGPRPNIRLLSVVCLRGGVGATSLAVNLAGLLAREGRRVCLIDLSPSSGHAALMLRLRAKPSWADLPEEINAQNLGFALVKHDSGLQLLASPAQPQSEGFNAEKFNATVFSMINFFTDIVVDCAPMLDAATRAAIAVSDRVLLPLAPEVTAVQTMTGTLGAMASLQVPLDEIRLILNHPTATPTLLPARIENALKRPLDAVLPFDAGMAAALLQGAPLFLSQPRSPYMTALSSLLQKL